MMLIAILKEGSLFCIYDILQSSGRFLTVTFSKQHRAVPLVGESQGSLVSAPKCCASFQRLQETFLEREDGEEEEFSYPDHSLQNNRQPLPTLPHRGLY